MNNKLIAVLVILLAVDITLASIGIFNLPKEARDGLITYVNKMRIESSEEINKTRIGMEELHRKDMKEHDLMLTDIHRFLQRERI